MDALRGEDPVQALVQRLGQLLEEHPDGERSVILDQVEAGVSVRMAVLELLLSGSPSG